MIYPLNPTYLGRFYKCPACEVSGRGDECWCCGSEQVVFGTHYSVLGSTNTWSLRDDGYAPRPGVPPVVLSS